MENKKEDKPEDSKKPTVTVDLPAVDAEFKFFRDGGKGNIFGDILRNWKVLPKTTESKPAEDPPAGSSSGSFLQSNLKRPKAPPKTETDDPFIKKFDQERAEVYLHDLEHGTFLGKVSPDLDLKTEISILVRYPGRVRTLRVKPTTTVMEIKEMISILQEISICNLSVLYHEQILDDDWQLYQYSIKNDAMIRIKINPCPQKFCDFCKPGATEEPDPEVD